MVKDVLHSHTEFRVVGKFLHLIKRAVEDGSRNHDVRATADTAFLNRWNRECDLRATDGLRSGVDSIVGVAILWHRGVNRCCEESSCPIRAIDREQCIIQSIFPSRVFCPDCDAVTFFPRSCEPIRIHHGARRRLSGAEPNGVPADITYIFHSALLTRGECA